MAEQYLGTVMDVAQSSLFACDDVLVRGLDKLWMMDDKKIQHVLQAKVYINPRFTTKAGRAWFRKNIIELHPAIIENDFIRRTQAYETFIHEFAHLSAFNSPARDTGHGKTWRQHMRAFGLIPERCYSHELKYEFKTHKFKEGLEALKNVGFRP